MNRRTLRRIVKSPSVGQVVPLALEIGRLNRECRRLFGAMNFAADRLSMAVELDDIYTAMSALSILEDALERIGGVCETLAGLPPRDGD